VFISGGPRKRTFPARTIELEEVDSLLETELVFVREVKSNNMDTFDVCGVMYPPATGDHYFIGTPPIYPRTALTIEVSAEEYRNRVGSVCVATDIFGTPPVLPRTRPTVSDPSDLYGDNGIDFDAIISEIEPPNSPNVATSVEDNYYRRLLLSDHALWTERAWRVA
jgi:hypothetical protein